MAKVVAKRKKRSGRTDPKQFERFIEAARKRGVNETLEEFAAKFRKIAPPKRRANDHPS
jgi:DNA-binding IclR family transcriptional regulator